MITTRNIYKEEGEPHPADPVPPKPELVPPPPPPVPIILPPGK